MTLLRGALEWEPRDCWIGVYWTRKPITGRRDGHAYHLWICVLPCLPLHLWWERVP